MNRQEVEYDEHYNTENNSQYGQLQIWIGEPKGVHSKMITRKHVHLERWPYEVIVFPHIRKAARLTELVKREFDDLKMLVGT